jgi:hypothetical protein
MGDAPSGPGAPHPVRGVRGMVGGTVSRQPASAETSARLTKRFMLSTPHPFMGELDADRDGGAPSTLGNADGPGP